MAASNRPYRVVAAFDFGTTYSGYAFSFCNSPLKVQTNPSWVAGSDTLMSMKTPTCVLLDPNKNFHSFGFQAENKYVALAEEDTHHDWFFFSRFKMILHNNKTLSTKTTIDDVNGKKMEAKVIFAMSIRYLREHVLDVVRQRTADIGEHDFLYVITVPAIWDDSAKQFMREAAVQAGIDTSRLKLALEPEAASIWCQVVTDEAKIALAGSGTPYMVVDLGGGTADITVHEKQSDGRLKELHKVCGGPWGGMYVDNNFLRWLETLFGKKTVRRFKLEALADYLYMMREFESTKRSISSDSIDPITIRIPAALKKMIDEGDETTLEERIKALNLRDGVSIRSDRMRINPDIVREWFDEPVNNVIRHVKKIFDEESMSKGVDFILLVGGIGESQLVRQKFKNTFHKKNLIIPTEASLAVLKGAVRFGHEPSLVSARVSQYTYGIKMTVEFDESVHPKTNLIEVNNLKLLDNIFKVFVRVGQSVVTGYEVKEEGFIPNYLDSSDIEVFCSTDANPRFTTEFTCRKLGHLHIEHPEGNTLEDKKLDITFVFGDTELIVKARIKKTGREFYLTIDCLSYIGRI